MWLILFHNLRPTFQVIFNLRTLRKSATWEWILLTWCWLHSKGLMRMNHSDMKLKIHRATAPQRNHVAFAAKKEEEENCKILFFFITTSFGINEYSGYVINSHNHEESQPSHAHSRVTASGQHILGAVAGARLTEPWAYPNGKVKWPFCSCFGDTVDFKYGLKNDARSIFTWP